MIGSDCHHGSGLESQQRKLWELQGYVEKAREGRNCGTYTPVPHTRLLNSIKPAYRLLSASALLVLVENDPSFNLNSDTK